MRKGALAVASGALTKRFINALTKYAYIVSLLRGGQSAGRNSPCRGIWTVDSSVEIDGRLSAMHASLMFRSLRSV